MGTNVVRGRKKVVSQSLRGRSARICKSKYSLSASLTSRESEKLAPPQSTAQATLIFIIPFLISRSLASILVLHSPKYVTFSRCQHTVIRKREKQKLIIFNNELDSLTSQDFFCLKSQMFPAMLTMITGFNVLTACSLLCTNQFAEARVPVRYSGTT